jgi:hypothetical protein
MVLITKPASALSTPGTLDHLWGSPPRARSDGHKNMSAVVAALEHMLEEKKSDENEDPESKEEIVGE